MKLITIIPIYKRHDLTRLCFEHLARQSNAFGFDVLIAGSEGNESEALAAEFGFGYIETPNDPLGLKFNLLMQECKDYDAVVVLGSDDFLPDHAWLKYFTLDVSIPAIYGYSGVYFYGTRTKAVTYVQYKSVISTIGAGRLYTKPAMELIQWKPWSDDQPKGLDTNATKRCAKLGIPEIVMDQVEMIDVKHSHNVTSHAILRVGKKSGVEVLRRAYTPEFMAKLESLQYVPGNDQLQISFKRKAA